MNVNFRPTFKTMLVATPVLMLVIFIALWAGVEKYTSTSSFCGSSCHTMSEQYVAWKNNKHHGDNNEKGLEAGCVDCHFLPGEHSSLKAKYEGLRHLAAYLYDPTAPLPIRPKIPDGACLTSGCHGDDGFEEKDIQFTPKARFKHAVHLGDKAFDGQKLTCDTCHFKVTEEKHFEVPKEICFLCHLKLEKPSLDKATIADGMTQEKGVNLQGVMQQSGMAGMEVLSAMGGKEKVKKLDTIHESEQTSGMAAIANDSDKRGISNAESINKSVNSELMSAMSGMGEIPSFKISFKNRTDINFDEGKSRCDICHTIPTKSLQAQLSSNDSLKETITHQSIKKAGVPCESCHFEVISGHGEIETGNVVSNGCLRCHNISDKLLESAKDKTLMHSSHVPSTADCFDCHKVVEHKNKTDHLDFVREDCGLCHQDQHKYQKLLLAGIPVNEDVSATPHLMFNVNVNCMGCHLKKTLNKGHAIRSADGKTCVACHTPGHQKMLEDWKETVTREVKDVEEFELEVLVELKNAAENLTEEQLKRARISATKGQELLNIVRFGNGVHNKKYSINILDQAFTKFEEVLDIIDE